MGHVFVPAALVLGLGVAVVRAWATPAPAPQSLQAVEVQHPPRRPAESSGKSVSQAPRPPAQVKREG